MFYEAKKLSTISEVERMSAIILGRIAANVEYRHTFISFCALGYSAPISSSFNDDLEEIIADLIDRGYGVEYYYKTESSIDPCGLVITWGDNIGLEKEGLYGSDYECEQ